MGFESGGRTTISSDDASDAISNALDFSAEVLAEAGKHLETGLKIAGISKPAMKLIEDLNKHAAKPVLSWFLKQPALKMLQIAMVAGQVISGGPAKAEDFAKAVNTTYQMTQTLRKVQSIETTRDLKSSEAPDVKVQQFFDAIRDPIQKLRSKFADTGDQVKDQAWRVAAANVLVEYNNRITDEGLNKVPGFQDKLTQILGAPVSLSDILGKTETPAYKADYSKFKEQLFVIYKDPEFARLQHEVRDSRLYFYYEVLDRANDDQPNYEQYRLDNKDLIAEAAAFFKKDSNLLALMNDMPQEEYGIREDKRGQRVALDIPEGFA